MRFIDKTRKYLAVLLMGKESRRGLIAMQEDLNETKAIIETIVRKLGWKFIHDIHYKDIDFEYEDSVRDEKFH